MPKIFGCAEGLVANRWGTKGKILCINFLDLRGQIYTNFFNKQDFLKIFEKKVIFFGKQGVERRIKAGRLFF